MKRCQRRSGCKGRDQACSAPGSIRTATATTLQSGEAGQSKTDEITGSNPAALGQVPVSPEGRGPGQDVIYDLRGRGVIDLSRMHANRDRDGDRQFAFAEGAASCSVWLVPGGADTISVPADVTGDAKADFCIAAQVRYEVTAGSLDLQA